jgi:hypothetical protein
MEPRELDNYIGAKLREAEKAGSESETGGVTRVWSAIEPQLGKRIAFHWVKMAAVILLLLMPSVYLFLRNREQGRQILSLNSKLALIEKSYRQKLQAFSANQQENVFVLHDTIRLIKTVEKKIIPETVEIVKYVTDTVIIYQEPDRSGNLAGSEPKVPSGDDLIQSWQESPVRTEYILSQDASVKKKKKSRSFHISLGPRNNSPRADNVLVFKTKL